MDIHSLGLRTNVEILRLGGSVISQRGEGADRWAVVRSPHNPTYWWGNFLLVSRPPAPDAVSRWLARYAAELPDATHVAIGVDGTEPVPPAQVEPWRAAGYEVTVDTVLTAAAVHDPPSPNRQATYRPLASDDDWAAAVDLGLACNERDLPGYAAFVADSAAAHRRLVEDGHAIWVGAFLDGHLVAQMGLVNCGDGLARYQQVETHPAMRGRGLASTLVAATARCGAALWSPSTFVIVADPGYHAIDIYRRAGFTPTQVQTSIERQPPTPST